MYFPPHTQFTGTSIIQKYKRFIPQTPKCEFPLLLWWRLVTFWFIIIFSTSSFMFAHAHIFMSFWRTSPILNIWHPKVLHIHQLSRRVHQMCDCDTFKQTVSWQRYNHLSVLFSCCCGALTCESPEFLWTYLTSDLPSMSHRQQIAAAAMEGFQLVLTHIFQFRLTGPCLLWGNNEWVRRSDYYKWLWLVLTINDLLRRILHPLLNILEASVNGRIHTQQQILQIFHAGKQSYDIW